jgi:cell division initiation protein
MRLTKLDILNKQFSRSLRGYTRAEVDQFLAEAAEALGELAEDRQELKRKLADLETVLAEHKAREESLRDTLISSQKVVDEMKANARKEAQLLVDGARGQADALVDKAHQRIAAAEEEIAGLRRIKIQFETQLRGLVEAHLRVLDEGATPLADEPESNVTYLQKKAT